jgi:ubiquitin-protein ligase E3 A
MQTMLGQDASPFLILIVRRSHVIEDALNQIAANIADLKKPLRVKFAGEEGVDAGGVQKEFFHLCIEQIVDLNYGRAKNIYNYYTQVFSEILTYFMN